MEKVLEVQQEVKNNAGDLGDYLRDLDSWTKQMETKDEQLKKAKKIKKKDPVETKKVASTAPVKKVIQDISSPPKKIKKESVATSKVKSVKPRDYSEWDKFDVDAACEEVEKSTPDEEDGNTSEEEELENERLMVEAVAEKDRGNDWFKKGNYDKAIERYTRGMNLDPLNAVLPANRAMALLKKGQFGAAETDCTLALSIDTTYIKAFQRRASARIGLDKLELAIQDYDQVLMFEPKNKAAKMEKEKLVLKLKDKSNENKPDNISTISSFNKFEDKMKGALSKNDSKPGTKIEKLEVAQTKIYSKTLLPQSVAESDEVIEGLVLPIQKQVHSRSGKPLKRIEITEISSATSKEVTVKQKVVKDANPVKEVTKSTGLTKKVEKDISDNISKVEIVNTIPPVPGSSSKFFIDWKSLKTIVNRAKYLQQFTASDYTTVFKSSLDGVVFTELVMVLNHLVQRGVMPEVVVSQLQGLSGLPRVSAIAMFMSKQDQDRLRYVIGELEIANPEDKKRWEKVFSI